MRMRRIAGIGLAVTFLVAVGGLWGTAADLDRAVDFSRSLLIDRPNQFLVCPPGYCKDTPHMTAPTFAMPRQDLVQAWDSLMAENTGFVLLRKNDKSHRRDYEQRTKWLRFPDRLTVEVVALEGGKSSLAIYSRSKYGYSDMGLNEARVSGLLNKLTARLPKN